MSDRYEDRYPMPPADSRGSGPVPWGEAAPDPFAAPDPYAAAPDGYAGAPDSYAAAPDGYAGAPDSYAGAPDGYAGASDRDAAVPYDPYTAPEPYQGQVLMRPAAPSSGVSIASMVCGIVSVVGVWIAGPVAIILAILGMRETADGAKQGRGMAIAGLVTGIIGTLFLLFAVAYFAFIIVISITMAQSS